MEDELTGKKLKREKDKGKEIRGWRQGRVMTCWVMKKKENILRSGSKKWETYE